MHRVDSAATMSEASENVVKNYPFHNPFGHLRIAAAGSCAGLAGRSCDDFERLPRPIMAWTDRGPGA
jgi:hypothetical protein